MTTGNLISALFALGEGRARAQERRYKLIGDCLTLAVASSGKPYTPELFELAMEFIDDSDNDLLEAMIIAYQRKIMRRLNPEDFE